MPVFPAGSLNPTALTAPDLYVQVISPQTRYINGVPTDILGLVGVASWGPVSSVVLVGSPSDQARYFGSQANRTFDLSTAITVALQQGAQNMRCVRVTDGTDAAATALLLDTAGTPATGMTLTAIYTGTLGNTIQATISTGSKASTYKLSIQMPGVQPEIYDNIGGSGLTLWQNLVNAVNNGISATRGPSQLAVATIASSTAAPNTTTVYTMSGGLDGASGVTNATLVGTDGTSTTRKGMYALRSSGASVLNLVDHTDYTAWSTIASFAQAEGMYAVVAGSAGQSYSTVSSNLGTSGADSPWIKVLVGDWTYWFDQVNSVQRLLSPASFVAAKIAATAPQLSSLNNQMTSIIGTQRVSQNQPYSEAEIGAIASARLDFITNPVPGGQYYACRTGRNASSDPTRNGDNYTRMTNYLAFTIASAFGYVIGQPQTVSLRQGAKAAIESFLSNLQRQGMIGDVNNPTKPAFSVEIDAANNPSSQVALGYMQANVKVKYLSIVWFFLVDLEGGQSVTVTPQ